MGIALRVSSSRRGARGEGHREIHLGTARVRQRHSDLAARDEVDAGDGGLAQPHLIHPNHSPWFAVNGEMWGAVGVDENGPL